MRRIGEELAKLLGSKRATQRATARLLGVAKATVQRDLSDGPSGPQSAPKPNEVKPAAIEPGPNGPPSLQTVLKAVNNQERQASKGARRAEREADLGAKLAALPEKVYGVVLADPPWRFEPYSRETGMDRAAHSRPASR